MEEIAGQADLLALNAAIEAARTGSRDKGFSVAGTEMRKLTVSKISAACRKPSVGIAQINRDMVQFDQLRPTNAGAATEMRRPLRRWPARPPTVASSGRAVQRRELERRSLTGKNPALNATGGDAKPRPAAYAEQKGAPMGDRITIATRGVSAAIALDGAELVSLRDADGSELLWQAGPQWPRHAPVLFPIVGRLVGDALRHEGRTYRLTQHGFARDRRFEPVEAGPDRAVLRLRDDAETRTIFPFGFALDLIYAVADTTLSATARVVNTGTAVLPFGLGAHPGFRWPLVDGVAKADHAVESDAAERAEALSVEGGLLGPSRPIPLDGRVLPLSEALFADDAVVLPDVASRSLRYVARNADGSTARALQVSWEGYKDLGLWSKPGGAPFLCIEPWYSMASPAGWDGDFTDKPGILHLAPGESREMTWRVTL